MYYVSLVSDRRKHCFNCKRLKAENQGGAEICVAKSNEPAQLRTDHFFSLSVRLCLKSSVSPWLTKMCKRSHTVRSRITQRPQMTPGFTACVYMQMVDDEWCCVCIPELSFAAFISGGKIKQHQYSAARQHWYRPKVDSTIAECWGQKSVLSSENKMAH